MRVVPENKAYLTRDEILAVVDIPVEEVPVPEWGGVVRVRGMSAGERVEYSTIFQGEGIPRDAQARMAQMCITDEDGNAVFTPEDISALSDKSGVALGRVSEAVMRLSGMDEDTEKN